MNADPVIVAIEKEPAKLERPMLQFYLDYWHRKRGDRVAPMRSDIVMRELTPYAGNIVICEALPGFEDFRFRLIGTGMTRHFLGDTTGTTVREECRRGNASSTFIERMVTLYRDICESGVAHLVRRPTGEWRNSFVPEHEVLYLPLAAPTGEITMLLMVHDFHWRSRAEA